MIAKKNEKLNFEQKRKLIFQLGLLATTAATLAAFTYRSPLEIERAKERVAVTEIDFEIETKVEEPQIIIQPQQQNQQDDQNDDSNPDDNLNDSDPNEFSESKDNDKKDDPIGDVKRPDFGKVPVKTEVSKGDVEPFPDVEASFIGGHVEMVKNINRNLVYPEIDIQNNIQGRVTVQFVVEKDGTISNIEIIESQSKTLDREAKRIVKNFPKWKPGEKEGLTCRTVVILPIRFTLD